MPQSRWRLRAGFEFCPSGHEAGSKTCHTILSAEETLWGDVLIRTEGTAGRITLNRPRALNALTLEMIRAMTTALTEWAGDPEIHFVLLDGAGERGVCAGGDIHALYDAAISGNLTFAAMFFREEYRLNEFISQYPKPCVALMDGVVMGGGI